MSDKGDTLVAITLKQAKYFDKLYEKVEYLIKNDSTCNVQYNNELKKNENYEKMIMKQEGIIENTNKIIELKEHQIKKLEESLTEEKRQVKKQRLLKIIYSSIGAAGTGFFFYLWLTK